MSSAINPSSSLIAAGKDSNRVRTIAGTAPRDSRYTKCVVGDLGIELTRSGNDADGHHPTHVIDSRRTCASPVTERVAINVHGDKRVGAATAELRASAGRQGIDNVRECAAAI